ncbi:GntR family transcriptional regulator [bacterium 210820-DFI.6.37]|nr:GntR family transcriptional regulator [bacterium 210820-DFI.6.37]
MEFKKITSPSLKELFIEQLEHMILSGTLSIGEKLPPERQLAETMQVSRGVVNSGLSELEKKGFLEIHPRSGTYVSDYRKKGTLETLSSIMNYNGGKLRRDEVRSILEVRIALDTLAVDLCIDRVTDEEILLMQEHVESIRNAESISDAVEGAYAFQNDMAMFSGNTLIPLIFHSFKVPVFALWERFCVLYGIQSLYQNNYELWISIKNRDKDRAISWVNTSISDSISGSKEIYFD